MYSYLNGLLTEKTPDLVVIECNGIGFEVKIPLSTFDQLPDKNQSVKLLIYTYHNDEGTKLFGFFKQQEKELFKLLINVNRIGPKIGLAILSSLSVKELIKAIISNNDNIISKTPGLGKKSAQRLIIELKDKINDISELDIETAQITQNIQETNQQESGLLNQEVESALTALGYKPYEIKKAFQNIKFTDKMTTQEIVKSCIKYIYLKRNES